MTSTLLEDNEAPSTKKVKKQKKISKLREIRVPENRTFVYTGIDLDGNSVTGKITAANFNEAKYAISNLGLDSFDFREAKKWYQLEFGRAVPLKILLQSTRQLASFAQAGIPIIRGIELMARTSENARMRLVFKEVQGEIEGGSSFSEAVSHLSLIHI